MKSAFLVLKFSFLLLFSERVIEMSRQSDISYVPRQLDKHDPTTEMKLAELLKTQKNDFVIALTEDNQEGTEYLIIKTIDGLKQWVVHTPSVVGGKRYRKRTNRKRIHRKKRTLRMRMKSSKSKV
jgi:hypothetical protein